MRAWLVSLLFLFTPALASAGEVIESHVNFDDDHYLLHLDMRVSAPRDAVYAVLLDFDNIKQVNDTIVFSKLLESDGKQHRVHFASEGCIWIFCRRVEQVVTVTELGNGFIMSRTHPEESDMQYGKTLWQVIDEGDTTRITYNADYVPDFWVPPLIGPYIFQKRILEEGLKTINGIEALASTR